jgi:hypothetical protein
MQRQMLKVIRLWLHRSALIWKIKLKNSFIFEFLLCLIYLKNELFLRLRKMFLLSNRLYTQNYMYGTFEFNIHHENSHLL